MSRTKLRPPHPLQPFTGGHDHAVSEHAVINVGPFANDDTLQCTFDLRRSEQGSGGDADWD